MNIQTNKPKRMLIATGAILGWFAILLQLYLILEYRSTSIAETLARYFTFFTILTNILVTICFTSLLLDSQTKIGKFLSKPESLSAVTIYIVVVGLVYNFILRFLWSPTGLQKIADELLHAILPILFVLFWIIFVPKRTLQWKTIVPWLLYPLVYLIIIIIRGLFSGYYPYPFVDISTLGYVSVAINCVILFCVFLGLSLFLVAIAKFIVKK